MTETEKKALALLNEVAKEMGLEKVSSLELDMPGERALLRAIEQHEAFRQKVSAMLIDEYGEEFCRDHSRFVRFIIPKTDPLVEAWLDAFPGNHIDDAREECAKINAALAARGLEIREKQP